MLARMMQMLMNEDFVEKLKAAKTPKEFLAYLQTDKAMTAFEGVGFSAV